MAGLICSARINSQVLRNTFRRHMSMRQILVLLSPALLAPAVTTSWADGYTSISGKLGKGWEVHVDTEPPITVWVWQRQKDGGIVNSHEYKTEACTLAYEYSKQEREVRVLKCSANGNTPLAGTKYVGHPFDGDCENGDPEFLFKCVSGCGSKSRAPKTMRQEHWEC